MFYKRVLHKPLGKILIEKGIITPEQLREVLEVREKEGGLTGEILVRKGYASEEDIMFALMSQYEIPYLPLEQYELDFELFMKFPVFDMEKYEFVPIELIESVVSVSTPNPLSDKLVEYIKEETGLDAVVFISTPSEVKRIISQYKERYGLA